MVKIIDSGFPVDPDVFLPSLRSIYKKLGLKGTVVMKLGNEAETRQLNFQYRQKDAPTDVLSFPIEEDLPDGFYLGDILICFPVAVNQARENHVPVNQELFRLMVHGLLHLSGRDHEKDQGDMLELQESLLAEFLLNDE